MIKFFSKNKNKAPLQKTGDEANFTAETAEKKAARNKKLMVAAILVVGIGALSLSAWNIGRLMKVPDLLSIGSGNDNSDQLAVDNSNTAPVRLEELKTKDTDKDGLSDYDELYVYHTSPYLADSDSDGISDKTEIDQGTDPNCPKGSDCGRVVANSNTNSNSNANTNGQFGDIQPSVDVNNLTAAQLRELLRSNGASESDLAQINDAQLMATYQEVLGTQQAGNSNVNGTVTSNTNIQSNTNNTNQGSSTYSYDQLKSLTPAEIRSFLIASGVPQATLDSVDDATLQTVYLQALADQQSSSQ